jgi:hypothetical protein
MLRKMKFNTRDPNRPRTRANLPGRTRLALCETLEARRLLTQFTWNVPQNDGYTAVYLQEGARVGWVNVRKN